MDKDINLQEITANIKQALQELLNVANLKPKSIVIIGCSTSEVAGKRIGSSGSLEIAKALMDGLLPVIKENNLFLAIQCCEHLNRAIVVEELCVEKYNFDAVTVVPQQHAGGSLATIAMEKFKNPIVIENIQGHAGLDIGDTFIGMHLKRVAVPIRLSIKSIGDAYLTAARVRPKLIGGERAVYCE